MTVSVAFAGMDMVSSGQPLWDEYFTAKEAEGLESDRRKYAGWTITEE